MKSKKMILITTLLVVILTGSTYASLTWSTAVDHSSPLTNQMRAVAVGNDSVYIGYIQTYNNGRDVHRHDTDSPYTLLNTRGLSANQPKGIATDDRGYVYVGNREGSGSYAAMIAVHDVALGSPLTVFNASQGEFGGVATHRIGNSYYMYIAREASGHIHRYDITDIGNITLDTSFGTNGVYAVAGGNKLRGITVDSDGTIFVADRDNNSIFRISADLASQSSATVTKAMDVALFNGKIYATSYNGANSLISVFDAGSLLFDHNIIIGELDGNTYTRGTGEGFSGIDIGTDGRIWICDQAYGSNMDRLLVSSPIPEPATLALLGLGALGLLRKRK